jgi:hypothetical protein
MNKNDSALPQREIVRLTAPVYADLEKKCTPPRVTDTTTAHHAGYMLGIQFVLKLLREGYVVQTS